VVFGAPVKHKELKLTGYLEQLSLNQLYPSDLGTVLDKLSGRYGAREEKRGDEEEAVQHPSYAFPAEWYQDVMMAFDAADCYWSYWLHRYAGGGMMAPDTLRESLYAARSLVQLATELRKWVQAVVAKVSVFRHLVSSSSTSSTSSTEDDSDSLSVSSEESSGASGNSSDEDANAMRCL
jgi:hypothetical protein